MTSPVGVYDLRISKAAFKVTVKDASWKRESQEISGTDTLQYNAQLLFFPLWQLICEWYREGDAPCDCREGPGPHASHSSSEKWLAVASVLVTVSPAASCTEQYKLL